MIVCKSITGEVLWTHHDNTLKEQDIYHNDLNVIVVDKELIFPVLPEGDGIYKNMWNEEKQEIYLERVGTKIPTHREVLDKVKSTTTITSEDVLVGTDLQMLTQDGVKTVSTDNLTNMDLLMMIMDTQNKIISHLSIK